MGRLRRSPNCDAFVCRRGNRLRQSRSEPPGLIRGSLRATNVLAHEPLFWVWFAAALLAVAFHIAYTVLFYNLFRPVNQSGSLLAASFSLVACALQGVAALFQLAPFVGLGGGSALSALSAKTVQAL